MPTHILRGSRRALQVDLASEALRTLVRAGIVAINGSVVCSCKPRISHPGKYGFSSMEFGATVRVADFAECHKQRDALRVWLKRKGYKPKGGGVWAKD